MSCTLDTPQCHAAHDQDTDTPPCCRTKIIEAVALTAAVLDDLGARWWIDYGTLLGHVRRGGEMLPWDFDADISMMAPDFERVKGEGIVHMAAAGLWAHYHPPNATKYKSGDYISVWRSGRNRNGLDLFPWYMEDDGLYHRKRYASKDPYKGRAFPPGLLFPLRRETWEGIAVNVPAHPEAFVEHRYGPRWREVIRRTLNDGVER